jgi:hypothetical protein
MILYLKTLNFISALCKTIDVLEVAELANWSNAFLALSNCVCVCVCVCVWLGMVLSVSSGMLGKSFTT